jgi:hypothetical protein
VREVWLESFGEDVGLKLTAFLGSVSQRHIAVSDVKKCVRLDVPVDPCFVLLQPEIRQTLPHVGIWHQGRVLHLGAKGAEFMLLHLVVRRYRKVSYFL